MNKNLIGNLQILLGASFFGLIPIFVRLGNSIDTLSLVFYRALFGAVAIFMILKIQRRKLQPVGRDFLKVVIWSLILLVAIGSYFYSLKKIDIASATLLLSLNSVFIILFSRIFLNERIYAFTIGSLMLSLIGVVFIMGLDDGFEGAMNIGYLAALSAAFWAAVNFIFPKIYFKSYDTHSMTFYQCVFQIPFLLPFMFMTPIVLSMENILVFSGLGLFCTALAFTLIYSGSQKTKSQFIGIFQTSEFIVPIVLACFIFKEYPTVPKIIGGVLLILAYVIVVLGDLRKNRALNQKGAQSTSLSEAI